MKNKSQLLQEKIHCSRCEDSDECLGATIGIESAFKEIEADMIEKLQQIVNESTDIDGFGTTDYELIGERLVKWLNLEKRRSP